MADGADESPAAASDRDGFFDGAGGVLVREFAPGERSGAAGRRCLQHGAGTGESKIAGTLFIVGKRGPGEKKDRSVIKSMPTVLELASRISLISESSTMKVAADADR